MADKQLRIRLGVAVSQAFTDQHLDYIHDSLMGMEESGKVGVTAKFAFAIDTEGILEVELDMKANMPLANRKLKLRSDGKQLRLWDTKLEPLDAAPETSEVEREVEPERKKKAAPARAKKKAPKKKGSKKAPKKQIGQRKASAAAAPVKRPRRQMPQKTAQQRLDEVNENNAALYRSGAISRGDAEAAGVDVDAIDGTGNGHASSDELNLAETFGGSVGDLTEEELDGLDELLD